MYRDHFGLLRKPFEPDFDADTFFLGEMQKQILAGLKQDVLDDASFLLLTGGAGAGKTSLLTVLMATLEIRGHLVVMTNPVSDAADFFMYLGAQLGLRFKGNKAKFLVLFANLLEECRENGRKILLIMDEAHLLPIALLEDLRLLANLASEVKSVFSILMVGQPEILGRLTQEQLFLLNQRLAVRYHLGNLSREESQQYILFRLNRAGAGRREIFSKNAQRLLYEATGGNPRQLNMLCDNALSTAQFQGAPAIDEGLMLACVERLHVGGDEGAFLLPLENKAMKKNWLVWVVVGVLLLEGAGVGYAYQKGWLVPVCQYLMRSIKLG